MMEACDLRALTSRTSADQLFAGFTDKINRDVCGAPFLKLVPYSLGSFLHAAGDYGVDWTPRGEAGADGLEVVESGRGNRVGAHTGIVRSCLGLVNLDRHESSKTIDTFSLADVI